MSFNTAMLVVAIGACIGLLCVELNDESKLHFGLPAILWGFLMTSALGMMAGSSLGFETVQISSGADPDYESIKVREVSDSERWNNGS